MLAQARVEFIYIDPPARQLLAQYPLLDANVQKLARFLQETLDTIRIAVIYDNEFEHCRPTLFVSAFCPDPEVGDELIKLAEREWLERPQYAWLFDSLPAGLAATYHTEERAF
jgi:hypothetical protein